MKNIKKKILKTFSFWWLYFQYNIFDLTTTYTPISAVKQSRSIQITARVLFVYYFIKAYAVGTHLNCIDLSMQFK